MRSAAYAPKLRHRQSSTCYLRCVSSPYIKRVIVIYRICALQGITKVREYAGVASPVMTAFAEQQLSVQILIQHCGREDGRQCPVVLGRPQRHADDLPQSGSAQQTNIGIIWSRYWSCCIDLQEDMMQKSPLLLHGCAMQGALRATLSVHAASWSSDLLTPPVASRQNVRLCPLSAINSILFASAESICSCTACLGWSMGADEAPIVSAVTNLQRRGSWVASLQVSTEISMPSSRCQEFCDLAHKWCAWLPIAIL